MAKKQSRGGRGNSGRQGPRAPRFTFEAGEHALPLSAKVAQVSIKEGTTSLSIKGSLLNGAPTHLRGLGQKVTVTSPTPGVSFIVGPDVKRSHTYSVPAGGDAPVFTVVGESQSVVALIYKGVYLYKTT